MKGLTVGLTIVNTNETASSQIWSNGLNQNIVFLGMLLQRLHIVAEVILIASPDSYQHPVGTAFGWKVMPISDAVFHCDLVIELGARCTEEHQRKQLHKRGGKLVSYVAGNVTVMNFEAVVQNRSHGDSVSKFFFDAVWVTPQHWHTCESYLKATRSPSTHQVPHIWDPQCIRMSAMESGNNPYWREPEDKRWRLACFDPNINVVKSFHIPLLAAEEAYRIEPSIIKQLLLFNAEHLKHSDHVKEIVNATEIGRAGKVNGEARHRIAGVMGKNVDAVITHHWENELNYLYWDVIYLGWPLIHNSKAIKEAGYYFTDFDTKSGGTAILEAMHSHARTRKTRRTAELEQLWQFSIDNPLVQDRHRELIEMVMSK